MKINFCQFNYLGGHIFSAVGWCRGDPVKIPKLFQLFLFEENPQLFELVKCLIRVKNYRNHYRRLLKCCHEIMLLQ